MAVSNPILVCFANQKGGVGKTTLSVCFANYLVSKGVKCRIIDCDAQQSAVKLRNKDIKQYGDKIIPYPVEGYKGLDRQRMFDIISKVFQDGNFEVAIFDCAGAFSDMLIPLVANSNFIVTPFHYENMTITSTSEFILFINSINSRKKKGNPARLFLVPNGNDNRVGTRDELLRWAETREKFNIYGYVTPMVCRKADMTRISTISDLYMQLQMTSAAFDKIYVEMFGNLNPLREPIETLRIREQQKNERRRRSQNRESDADEAEDDSIEQIETNDNND